MNRTSLALIGMVFAGCQSLPSPEVAKSEAQAATEAWVAAFNSCDAGKVVALYFSAHWW